MKNDTPIPTIQWNPFAVTDDPATLARYTSDKLLLTHQVRLLEQLFISRQSKEGAAQCHELMRKLAEGRFTLAVVGQFKRGKSSLMNALVGRELLPTGVLPLTSAITIVRYGSREQLAVAWQYSDFESEEPLSALNDYVTEAGNPGNQKKVRAVYVETNSSLLRRGLELVDTPGIGSAIEANTATTLAFIPNCDAVIFVTGVDAPMTEAEIEFLRRLRRDVGKVFCVVNKMDLLPTSQKSEVIRFVTSQIHDSLGSSRTRVFGVSSRNALAADRTEANEVDGVGALQKALGEFLATGRSAVFLNAVIERSLRLLAAEESTIHLAQRAVAAPANIRQIQITQLRSQFERIDGEITERSQALGLAARASVIEASAPELDERLRLGVVALADGLVRLIVPGQWKSARWFMSVMAPNVVEAAQFEANEWLAGRKHAAHSALSDASKELRKVTVDLLRGLKTSAWAFDETVRSLCETDLPVDDDQPVELRVDARPWAPTPSRPLRYVPASMARRCLRRWLRPRVQAYAKTLASDAISVVEDFLTRQMRKIVETIEAFVRQEQERLLGALSTGGETPSTQSGALLERQAEKARQIETALLGLLPSLTGETGFASLPIPKSHPETAPNPYLPDSALAQVTVQDVLRDLNTGRCAVCRRLTRVLFDFFAKWQHLMAVDDAAQRMYAGELGFCPLHTWQLASISSGRGLSVGYPRLTERLKMELRSIAEHGGASEAVKRLLTPPNDCRACRMIALVQDQYVHRLGQTLENEVGRRAYASSRGVCLRHLPPLLALTSDPSIKRFLLAEAATHLDLLSEDMQTFALKQEATRRDLITRNEQAALRIAVEKIVGVKSLCFPWDLDENS